MGSGRSTYKKDAVEEAIEAAGIEATPLSEWCVSWPASEELRSDLKKSTLYVTLEPSSRRQGLSQPPLTQLIQMAGIPRVVIGTADPIPEFASEGAAAMHSAGLEVIMGVLDEDCKHLIEEYSELANVSIILMNYGAMTSCCFATEENFC